MRPFNDREKGYIKSLVNLKQSELHTFTDFLESKFFTEERGASLFVLNASNAVLFYDVNKYDNIDKCRKLLADFMEIYWLLHYLINENYIYTMGLRHPNETRIISYLTNGFEPKYVKGTDKMIYCLNDKRDYIRRDFTDKIFDKSDNIICDSMGMDSEYCDFINKHFFGAITITETLIEYVNDGYKTKEEKRFHTQCIISGIAIAISALIGLASILLSCSNILLTVLLNH